MKHCYHLRSLLFLILCITAFKGNAQKQGQAKVDSLFNELRTAKADTTQINTLNALAYEFRSNDPDTAIYFANQALSLSTKLKNKMGIADACLRIGTALTNLGEYEEALKNFNKAIKFYEQLLISEKEIGKSKILNQKAKAYNNIGNIYFNKGNYPNALKNYFASLKLKEEIKDTNGIFIAYSNLGGVYEEQENYVEALRIQFLALKISKESGNNQAIINSNTNIGFIYRGQNNFYEALKCFLESLKISKEIQDQSAIADSYNNIGIVYRDQGNYIESLNNLSAALKITEELGDKAGIANVYGNIGTVYYKQGDYKQAIKNHFACLNIYEKIGNKHGITDSYLNVGGTNTKLKKYDDAKKQLNNALSISKEIGYKSASKEIYSLLTELDSLQGNFKLAFEHYKLFVAYRDSLVNIENTRKTVQAQMQYDFDKKEATSKAEQDKKDAIAQSEAALAKEEIAKQKLLRNSIGGGAGIVVLSSLFIFLFYKRKRDAEQKQKETLLSLQVSETEMKALRSQMNPHFIFNALQSIQTFLLSNKSEDANSYLLKFSKLMRLVLENSQHSEVFLKDDIQALELYMQLESIRLKHPFTYQFHIDETVDVETTTIPPLILQPFVENAIWHGLQYKTEHGHINIYISKKDNALYATVEDNGVGRDLNKQAAQPMLHKKESLGMKLTEERLKILNELKKIKAEFKITDLFTNENKPVGTRVELSLPLVA